MSCVEIILDGLFLRYCNKSIKCLTTGIKHSTLVYHGGPELPKRYPFFVAEDSEVAKSYADDRGGKVQAYNLQLKNPASENEVEAVAKALGIYKNHLMPYEYLSTGVFSSDVPQQVMRGLQALGFDGAKVQDFSMDEQFVETTSYAVFDNATITPYLPLVATIIETLANNSPEQIGADIGGQVTDYDLRVPTNKKPSGCGGQHPEFWNQQLNKEPDY